MTIGDRIHDLRISKSYTMEELGHKVGVGKGTIKKYENGSIKNIPSDKIEAMAEALETTPEYLMGWTENEQQLAQSSDSGPVNRTLHAPKTLEARIVSFGMDSLPKEEREKILSILQTMYNNNPDLFKEESTNDA